MSLLAHIGREIPKQLITAIIEAGRGRALVEAFCERDGVLSISHHHARGVGTTRVRAGQMYFRERDVLLILVETKYAEQLFADLFEAGGVGEPGGGIIFSENVIRGHPMMPLDLADW